MISPPNSPPNSANSTAMQPADQMIRDAAESDLNFASAQKDNSKPLQGIGENTESDLRELAPDDKTNASENDDILLHATAEEEEIEFSQGNSPTRVLLEHVSVDTLKTYCIGHYVDQVRNPAPQIIIVLMFSRIPNT